MADYKLQNPIDADEVRTADAIVDNNEGSWLAEWDSESDQAMPLVDEDGDYISAPANWKELIVNN
jgi:hypothetical protein